MTRSNREVYREFVEVHPTGSLPHSNGTGNRKVRTINLNYDESGLPDEDPMENSPFGFDLSEIEVSNGAYHFERIDNDPYEYDPYRGGDWHQRAVYGDRSLMGGRGPSFRSLLARPEFMQALSIGLQRQVGFNPRAMEGNSPTIRQILSTWHTVLGKKIGKPVSYSRDRWVQPLLLWIHSLTVSEAGQYLLGVRKEISVLKDEISSKRNIFSNRMLLKVAEYGEQQLSILLSSLNEE